MSAPDTPDTSDSLIRQLARAPRRQLEDLEATGPVSEPTGARDAREALPRVGDVIDGRYQLENVIGSGGMGIVFAARNLRTEKKVALKYLTVPRQERTRSAERRAARFLREARAAGRVRHPNVVDMIDVGGDPAHPYLVMELLQGMSLYARMHQGPLPFHEAISILESAMHGVAEAHRQGVIHRDIKPENIFLAESKDGKVTPKVLDFGVSRITESSIEAPPTTLTQAGNVIGTPSYMPLEQLRGKTDVDARADVYSLGVVLYEALSGKRPFDAQNAHDLAIKMATESPERLVLHEAGSDRRPLDARLEAVVMRALARAPEDRYPSVEAFAAALANYREAPRPRVRLIVGVAVVLLTALGIAGWMVTNTVPGPKAARVVEADVSARAPKTAAPATPSQVEPAKGDAPARTGTQRGEASPAPEPETPSQGRVPVASHTNRKRVMPEARAAEQTPSPVPQVAPSRGAPIERAKTLLPDDF